MAGLAIDARSLDALRTQARDDPKAALKAAAAQFEAVFARSLIKSMREALPQDPLSSESTKLAQSLYDDQLAQQLAQRGLGLADMLVRQLGGRSAPPSVSGAGADKRGEFIKTMLPHAEAAARDTGVPAKFILGQAALESGWGSREIQGFNLFGVKAGGGWRGSSVEATTTEFVDGAPQKRVEQFRSYASYAEAFADYARLLKGNPRYAAALEAGADPQAFAGALARGGYATDPDYAAKLEGVIGSAALKDLKA